ncbi:basic proline-rich protein-like [Myotis myotis]|uniref:basic proline-rich protein-like n=1 Tax=Myotis myotis TaxID=51298 RepID=UPI00174AAECD|nr:basic proline-rich protein-like [Myotis myotis]
MAQRQHLGERAWARERQLSPNHSQGPGGSEQQEEGPNKREREKGPKRAPPQSHPKPRLWTPPSSWLGSGVKARTRICSQARQSRRNQRRGVREGREIPPRGKGRRELPADKEPRRGTAGRGPAQRLPGTRVRPPRSPLPEAGPRAGGRGVGDVRRAPTLYRGASPPPRPVKVAPGKARGPWRRTPGRPALAAGTRRPGGRHPYPEAGSWAAVTFAPPLRARCVYQLARAGRPAPTAPGSPAPALLPLAAPPSPAERRAERRSVLDPCTRPAANQNRGRNESSQWETSQRAGPSLSSPRCPFPQFGKPGSGPECGAGGRRVRPESRPFQAARPGTRPRWAASCRRLLARRRAGLEGRRREEEPGLQRTRLGPARPAPCTPEASPRPSPLSGRPGPASSSFPRGLTCWLSAGAIPKTGSLRAGAAARAPGRAPSRWPAKQAAPRWARLSRRDPPARAGAEPRGPFSPGRARQRRLRRETGPNPPL